MCLSTDCLLAQFCLSYITAEPWGEADFTKWKLPSSDWMYMRQGIAFEVSASTTSPVSVIEPCAMQVEPSARINNAVFIV